MLDVLPKLIKVSKYKIIKQHLYRLFAADA